MPSASDALPNNDASVASCVESYAVCCGVCQKKDGEEEFAEGRMQKKKVPTLKAGRRPVIVANRLVIAATTVSMFTSMWYVPAAVVNDSPSA